MGFGALQVCMDSSDWLQEETERDSSSPPGEMLTCSLPVTERRLRPNLDQPLKCPRCESSHTKFCYYNNYSLSQPRYFCKSCRRYWTKGGTLRNIPVGGGCRKNKKVSSKKPKENDPLLNQNHYGSSSHNPDHQFQFSHLDNLLGNPSFLETKLINGDNAFRNYDFMVNAEVGMMGRVEVGDFCVETQNLDQNWHDFRWPYEIAIDGTISSGANFMDTCQRLIIPFHDHEANDDQNGGVDAKPAKISAFHWQEQDRSSWNTVANGLIRDPFQR